MDSEQILYELFSDIFYRILNIEEKQLRALGVVLTVNEVHILQEIRKSNKKTMTDVARRLRVTLGTLTTSIERLVMKGYVTRKSDVKDRRKVLLNLTSPAMQVISLHNQFYKELVEGLHLDKEIDKQESFLQTLQDMNEYFKSKYND